MFVKFWTFVEFEISYFKSKLCCSKYHNTNISFIVPPHLMLVLVAPRNFVFSQGEPLSTKSNSWFSGNNIDIFYSNFSSPITCSTLITQLYVSFVWDKLFGSLDNIFQCKRKGIGFAHPYNEEMAQQAIHWIRTTKHDPNTISILVIPNTNRYQNFSSHTRPFPLCHRY